MRAVQSGSGKSLSLSEFAGVDDSGSSGCGGVDAHKRIQQTFDRYYLITSDGYLQ